MEIIANTTILSNFASTGKLEWLHRLWERLYLPEQVFDEAQAGLLEGYAFYAGLDELVYPLSESGWLCLTALQSPAEFKLYGELLNNLHSGEAACLSIAYHRQWLLLSDDQAARKAGAALRIQVSGTLGVLQAVVKRNLVTLTEADQVLQDMVRGGYYSPVSSLTEILKS